MITVSLGTVHTRIYQYIQVHTSMYQNIHVHTKMSIDVLYHTSTTYHNVTVHTSTYKYIPLHTSTYQYILVHTSAYQCIPFLIWVPKRCTPVLKQQSSVCCWHAFPPHWKSTWITAWILVRIGISQLHYCISTCLGDVSSDGRYLPCVHIRWSGITSSSSIFWFFWFSLRSRPTLIPH